jgi:hypothetical protein
MPAQAGTHDGDAVDRGPWVLAFARMTLKTEVEDQSSTVVRQARTRAMLDRQACVRVTFATASARR